MLQFLNRLLRRRADGTRDEKGIAMIIAISVVVLLTLIPLIVFTQAVGQLPLARHDQDHESALHAAEAGVDEYMSRLAQNTNYWSTGDITNTAFTAWTAVPGPGANKGQFRYSVDTSQTLTSGIVYLTASGKSRNVIRTIKVGLRRQGFLDYLWFTDYERVDPALSSDGSSCLKYAWEKNGSRWGPDPDNCDVVFWTSSANLTGPVHSNDGFYVSGNPQFSQAPESYLNTGAGTSVTDENHPDKKVVVTTSSPEWQPAPSGMQGGPVAGANLKFPVTAAGLADQGDKSKPGYSNGCLYTGPTSITLNANGTMNVSSPKTKVTSAKFNNSLCNKATGSNPCCGSNIPIQSNQVIYVRAVPASSDPDYVSCSGTGCDGTASVSGTFHGQATIGADDDIVITGDVVYSQSPATTDVLGLVATNNVAVCRTTSPCTTPHEIDAAILALNHSFYVQSWDDTGLLGTLTVNGVIAQKYRGAVGTFSGTSTKTGYDKSYHYDTRLKIMSPPYFLSPVQSAWQKNSYSEIRPTATP